MGVLLPRLESFPRTVRFAPSLDWTLIERLVAEASRAEIISPCFAQEPLAEPRLLDILRLIRRSCRRAAVELRSGMRPCEDTAAACLVSEGLVELVHARISGYDSAVARVLALRAAYGRQSPRVEVEYAGGPAGAVPFPDFEAYWSPLADTVAAAPGVIRAHGPRVPCYELWQALNIGADGRAAMCCQDTGAANVIGDLGFQGLREIWRGAALKRIRTLHLTGRSSALPLCVGCVHWLRCNPDWWNRLWADKDRRG